MNNPGKPGWQTTEFWLSLLAVVVSYVMSTDLGNEETIVGRVLVIIATVLAALGYTAGRTLVKRAAINRGPPQ